MQDTYAARQVAQDFFFCTGLSVFVMNSSHDVLFTTNSTEPDTAFLSLCVDAPSDLTQCDTGYMLRLSSKTQKGILFLAGPVAHDYRCCAGSGRNCPATMPERLQACLSYFGDLLTSIEARVHAGQTDVSAACNVVSPYVHDAVSYIEAHISENIALEDVAEHLHLNKSYFCAVFKKGTGKTFSRYLNEARVHAAKKLLKDSGISVLDISSAVGFNNHSYFSHVFRKMTGFSPLEFRDTH